MANLVKYKAALSGTSIVIIVLFYGMLNSFQLNPEERPWSDSISWSDFKGVPHYFRSGDAGIYSRLSLEYDSITENYKVVALMNQSKSWHKSNADRFTNDILKHEQYHFNITEAYARLMNKYIKDNPDSSLRFYQTKLVQIERELDRLQEVYDDETNHSQILDQQAKWEYKIDSMLWVNSGNELTVDQYSGSSAFFPVTPDFHLLLSDQKKIVRLFAVTKYGLRMTVTIIQDYKDLSSDSINNFHIDIYDKFKATVDSSLTVFKNRILIQASSKEVNRNYYDLWHYEYPNIYMVSCAWNGIVDESNGFRSIAKSFVNSFELKTTDDALVGESGYSIVNSSKRENKGDTIYCFSKTYVGGLMGFIKGPLHTNDEGILFAVDFLEVVDSLVDRRFSWVNDEIINEMKTNDKVIYYVPAEDVNKASTVQLCYTLSNDSNPNCPNLY